MDEELQSNSNERGGYSQRPGAVGGEAEAEAEAERRRRSHSTNDSNLTDISPPTSPVGATAATSTSGGFYAISQCVQQ